MNDTNFAVTNTYKVWKMESNPPIIFHAPLSYSGSTNTIEVKRLIEMDKDLKKLQGIMFYQIIMTYALCVAVIMLLVTKGRK